MQKRFKRVLFEFILIILGCVLIALGLNLFLIPNKIAAGGVSGLSTVFFYMFNKKIPVGIIMLTLNLPLFIFGLRRLGRYFVIKTLAGTFLLSFLIDILRPATNYFLENYMLIDSGNKDLLLYSIFGGLIMGSGIGLVFKARATTGGSDLLASIIRSKFTNFSSGQILFFVDAIVVITSAIFFKSFLLGLYASITIYITSKTVDAVLEGINFSKAVLIISDKSDELAYRILNELDRGATSLKGSGMYTKKDKNIILCVINRGEFAKLKSCIKETDPDAFVILADVREVLGEGFHPLV